MNLLWNAAGAVDIDALEPGTTVQDLLDAIDVFLQANPLDCTGCALSCCRRAWSVEVDNVSAGRLCGGQGAEVSCFVREKLMLKRNHALGFNQFVLNKTTDCHYILPDNRCGVYAVRPIICRLYICGALSPRYNALRSAVGATYLQALVLEEAQRADGAPVQAGNNPALSARDYSLRLTDILRYAAAQGWLEDEKREELLDREG